MGKAREIEITPEMIEAGVAVLRRVNGHDLDAGWVSEPKVVTRILVASLSATHLPPTNSLSLSNSSVPRE